MSLQMEVELKHPFSMLISGGRGAGKSTFTKLLLKYRKELINPPPERVVWCYTKHQPDLLEELISIDPQIEYIQGIPNDIETMFNRENNNIIVLDDLMDEASQDNRVSKLFTRGRHDNLSVVYLTQNLFHKNQRNISINSDYMIIFKNPRDKTQFLNLAKQFMPRKYKFLLWAFEDATQLPRSYLMLDMKPETDDKFRVRAKLLPHEAPQLIYMPS